jgi:general secretion pathway protein H
MKNLKKGLGFSLLELMIVMAIVGMIAILVIPRVSSSQVALLKAQVREAAAVLNYARRSAIIRGKTTKASFYNKKSGENAVAQKSFKPEQWVSRGAILQWGEESQGKEKDETAYEITFYPEGGSSGGKFTLIHQKYRVTITVDPLTSKIESEFSISESGFDGNVEEN